MPKHNLHRALVGQLLIVPGRGGTRADAAAQAPALGHFLILNFY
jgi:hypothetical protein